MKKYFEYKFDIKVENTLSNYYENTNLNQHNANHFMKSALKLSRIAKLLSFTKDDVVLDVGCSSGSLIKSIANKIKRGKGVDISNSIIKSNIRINDLKNISFESYDGNTLNLQEKYNKVLLLDVLEHSFYPDKVIQTIKNNMESGGILIVEVPFTGFLSEIIFGEYHQGHLRYYDPQYLGEYLKKFGFTIIRVDTYNSVPWSSKFIKIPFIFKILDTLVNLISPRIYPYFGEIVISASK